ncbi:CBS domain-containing protein [Candidatus Parvarchaeota archaeon]|nr:CBS domain-containing protein [Candidatus Parvarchaeota archaeon]
MIDLPELERIIAEIRLERARKRIRSYKLAKQSGISRSAMSKLENNDLEPSYKLVYRVVKALNWLVGTEEKTNAVREKMVKPIFLPPDESISKAREIMKKKDISQIPIVDKNNNIIGIVTEKSILDNPKGTVCSDSMEFDYAILGPDSDLGKARQLIRNTQIILVVENKKLIGLLTKADFL